MRESHDNKYNMVHHQARRISHRAFFLNADKRFIDAMKRSTMFDHVYSYHLDRLASDGGVTYTYDAAGNRMTRMENGLTTTYTLGVGDRLASWTGGLYTYDIAGNVTRIERDDRPTLDLTWNRQYQLVSVATNGVFAEGYAYDARGCCVGWIPGFGDAAKSGGKLYKGAGKAQKAGKAWKSTNRRANKQIDDIAKKFGIDRNGFGEYIHGQQV